MSHTSACVCFWTSSTSALSVYFSASWNWNGSYHPCDDNLCQKRRCYHSYWWRLRMTHFSCADSCPWTSSNDFFECLFLLLEREWLRIEERSWDDLSFDFERSLFKPFLFCPNWCTPTGTPRSEQRYLRPLSRSGPSSPHSQ